MGTGQQFAKKLGAVGCVLILVMAVLMTVSMFTARGAPVEGYIPAREGDYYRTRPEELLEEIETNLLPKLDVHDTALELKDGKISVTAPEKDLQTLRLAVIYYFDPDLFEFRVK